tara:strand:+ start:46 stop:483 length:438 start_codon:yes stop_codon:yes gene_type:complete
MKAVIQRVESASVVVENITISNIKTGLLILLGIQKNDKLKDIEYLINKISSLRIFNDENGMNLSVQDISGEILVISQFTLCADTSTGRRPNFLDAENSDVAKTMYELFCQLLVKKKLSVSTGEFGAKMDVTLVNTGPVTIILESK